MKKEVKKATKKIVKKPTKEVKQDKALIITFILLIVLVVVLATVAISMQSEKSSIKANIVIPVLEENSKNEIGVDISDMKKGDTKEYAFKVSNYKDKEVLKKDLTYDIDISASKNVSIKIYKNNSKTNMIKEDDYMLEENNLPKNKKTEDEYHLIIEAVSVPEETDKITLKINS